MRKITILYFLLSLFNISYSQDFNITNFKSYNLNSKRYEINLNGVWFFKPVQNNTSLLSSNSTSWDKIQVPSSWDANFLLDSSLKKNGNLYNPDTVAKAIYKTQVYIPKSWKKNASVLLFEKISTDAKIYVNNVYAGTVNWYAGEVDISKQLKYGELNNLQIFIIATATEGEVPKLMGTATSQLTFAKSSLMSRGITGDIKLLSRPYNTYISDVFIKPSIRKKNVDIDIELIGIKKSGSAKVLANLYNNLGQIEKSFSKNIVVHAKDTQTVSVNFDWTNPRIWDLDKPEMYTLKLALSQDNGINDEYNQEFGFREFWIDGKDFYLNGTKINLRPHLFVGGNGMDELIDASIDAIRKNGFNISEIWPNNFDERGFLEHSERMMSRADKKGFLLMGVALPFFDYILNKSWAFQWDNMKVQKDFEKRMLINLKKDRNHPSVVMWTTTGNFFGDTQDQNPLNIGKKNWVKENPKFTKYANAGIEAINIIKKHDPTRPVFSHHGTYVGDVHTLNFYLGFIPLQEREEWLSEYAKSGQIPFMGIEFGTPLFCDFLRGRNGYGNNIKTEPLITEFTAMYLGRNAYLNEPQFYRSYIAENFVSGQEYQPMGASAIEPIWSFQQLQKLFIKNTWRSWRTYEISGGLLPWSNAHGWLATSKADSAIVVKPFEYGRNGYYYPQVKLSDLYDKLPPAFDILESGKALVESNNQTLAYIAGSKEAFTEKSHNFKPYQLINKQIVIFNDTRVTQKAKWKYSVIVNDKEVEKNEGIKLLLPASKTFESISFATPDSKAFKSKGMILLKVEIANVTHHDTLSFTIFKDNNKITNQLLNVYDPEGITNHMLNVKGYRTQNWNGDLNTPIIILGRNALSKGYKLPNSIESYIKNGGRVLCFNQDEKYLEDHGFRVSKFLSRYVFPVNDNTITRDIDPKDLSDWSGVSTMAAAYPDYINSDFIKTSEDYPRYGWHWGNRGSVATFAMEKPHYGSWTPILECEFDLAYSPLLELNYGKGKLVWCSLDLEDNFDKDPVANILLDRIVSYTIDNPIVPKNNITNFYGNDKDEKILKDLGVNYSKLNANVENTQLLICSSIPSNKMKEFENYVKEGGKLLILPQTEFKEMNGVKFKLEENFFGSLQIEQNYLTKGLSISDLKYRVNTPTIVVDSGCEIMLNGLLGVKKLGKGEIIFLQVNPDVLNADSLTYNRYTRWRLTRAISQILSNLGVSFLTDNYIFKPMEKTKYSIALDNNNWKAKMLNKYPAVTDLSLRVPDKGISEEALKLITISADDPQFVKTNVPLTVNDEIFKELSENDGEAIFKHKITIPQNMVGKDLDLKLSIIDDFDDTYFNGVKVGSTTNTTENSWNFKRTYTIPAKLVKEGENDLTIRVYDWYGGGGLLPDAQKREISLKSDDIPKIKSLYHEDYNDDFELGDNPFRYFRW